jgi:hypothetical protein
MLFVCLPQQHIAFKVVGGSLNVLVYYADVSAPIPSGFVVCNPYNIKGYILLFISDQKSFCFFVVSATTALMNFIPQPQI